MNVPHVFALPAAIVATAAAVSWVRPAWIMWRGAAAGFDGANPSHIGSSHDELSRSVRTVVTWTTMAAILTGLAAIFAMSSTIADVLVRGYH